MKIMSGRQRLGCISIALVSAFASSQAADIERPKVQIVDEFGVNLATGQVTYNMETVSIGGEMGLTHRISVYANELAFNNNRGFSDNMRSVTRYVNLSQQPDYSPKAVLRVSDFTDSADFAVEVNGTRVEQFKSTPPPYTYVPIGDERHELRTNGELLEWTKPDGTLVKFKRKANAAAGDDGLLSEIIYPNGFTITVTPGGMGIQSNTGFQLKSIYESDTRVMDKPNNPNLVNVHPSLTSQGSGWSDANPKYVKAINMAVEFCPPTQRSCNLTHTWPTATFEWPAGMPRTMYIGESVVSVIDAEGRVTKFRYLAHDLAYNEWGAVVQPFEPNRQFSPRLAGITPAGGASEQFQYEFKNVFDYHTTTHGEWVSRSQTAGMIKRAQHIQKLASYSMFQPYMGSSLMNTGGGYVRNALMYGSGAPYGNPDAISSANTKDGQIGFESAARNWPNRFWKSSGPSERYDYTRGNLTKLSYWIDGDWVTHLEAGYPEQCTSGTRKYCNQAQWIRDAVGNTTNYTYHPESGQVATITYPPNERGIRPQTRYEYEKKRARYFNGGSTKIEGSPIWLKTAERYCINSAAAGNGCSGGDEVVTRYEYEHDNLLLTGMTVTDPDGNTRRTCYQYDIYGNRIGVTEPKAGLDRC